MTANREESDNYRAIVARINDDWRVIVCRAGIQWIYQRRAGAQRHGASRWLSVGFQRHREGLILAVHERCGAVRPEAAAMLARLPRRIDLVEEQVPA
ncbi:MAG: hypothetical protein ACOH2M_17095 [Cypionkella sp.]